MSKSTDEIFVWRQYINVCQINQYTRWSKSASACISWPHNVNNVTNFQNSFTAHALSSIICNKLIAKDPFTLYLRNVQHDIINNITLIFHRGVCKRPLRLYPLWKWKIIPILNAKNMPIFEHLFIKITPELYTCPARILFTFLNTRLIFHKVA